MVRQSWIKMHKGQNRKLQRAHLFFLLLENYYSYYYYLLSLLLFNNNFITIILLCYFIFINYSLLININNKIIIM